MASETLVTFFTAALLLALAPGPDNVFVLTQSALYGRAAGFAVVLGLCTGLLFHTLAVALGVAAIFQTSAVAFSGLKYLGAAYLIFLAWQAFRAKATDVSASADNRPNLRNLYTRGVIMNITNPKVTVFFLALLPQFAEPARGSMAIQLVALGGLFIVATILVFGGIAVLAGTLRRWLVQSERVQLGLNKLAGLVFVGLALKLATAKQ